MTRLAAWLWCLAWLSGRWAWAQDAPLVEWHPMVAEGARADDGAALSAPAAAAVGGGDSGIKPFGANADANANANADANAGENAAATTAADAIAAAADPLDPTIQHQTMSTHLFEADAAAPVSAEEIASSASLTAIQREWLSQATPELLAAWDTDGPDLMWQPWRENQTEDGNAALHIARLKDLYLAEKHEGRLSVPPSSQGVLELIRAARQAHCRLSPDFYPEPETGDSEQPDYIVLLAYAMALLDHARQLADQGEMADAEEAYRSGLLVGRHLTDDAPTLLMFMAGRSIKERSATAYARHLRRLLRDQEAALLERYVEGLQAITQRINFKSQMLLGDMARFNCLPAAIRIAKEDQARFWRQEAVMRLGVMRWGAPSEAADDDESMIMEHDARLQQMAADALEWVSENDPDPTVRQLALWAFNHLTPERFVDMRHQALVVR